MSAQPLQTIESLDLTLTKIFSDFYVVPTYQREYVWGDEQVEQLLRDIHDEFSDDSANSEYFIGSMVVCPAGEGVLELIDGQQRMTTCYLFLCAMRDHLRTLGGEAPEVLGSQIAASSMNADGDEVRRYRVTLQYEDSVGVLASIAAADIEVSSIVPTTRSVQNIVNAYQAIRAFLRTEFKEDERAAKRFYAYFTNRVKLVRIKTQSVAHALKVFETINDRGVGLDAMDLLKNLMFMQARPADFDRLRDRWKELVDTLYQAKEKPLRFLRYFIFANYTVDRLKEDEIYRWFVANKKECGYETNPLGFVEKLKAAAYAFVHFVKGQNLDGTSNRFLQNLREVSGSARQHLILLLAGKGLGKAEFTELCRHIENLFFLYMITREQTRDFERNFAQWAKDLREVKDRTGLDTFVAAKFGPAKESFALRFQQAMESLDEDAVLRYRMRYILAKLTQYINDRAYGGEHPLQDSLQNVDVEHILPQTPSTEVRAAFDKPSEIDTYIHRLGNLTLLERSINSSVSNGSFASKREPYHKSKFLLTRTITERIQVGTNTAIDRAVEGLLTFDTWTSESIEMRQLMLTELAQAVWDMPRVRTPKGEVGQASSGTNAGSPVTASPGGRGTPSESGYQPDQNHTPSGPENEGEDSDVTEELTPLGHTQLAYWRQFREYARQQGSTIHPRKPQPHYYATYAIGTSHFELGATILATRRRIGVYFGIHGPHAKARFGQLRAHQAAIESEVGSPLTWWELPDKKASYISLYLTDSDPVDKSDWPRQHVWLLQAVEAFHSCFAPKARLLALGERLDVRNVNAE